MISTIALIALAMYMTSILMCVGAMLAPDPVRATSTPTHRVFDFMLAPGYYGFWMPVMATTERIGGY